MQTSASAKQLSYGGLVVGIIQLGIFIVLLFSSPNSGRGRQSAQRANDLSNIRSLGQASLIYASAHNDQLPHATDIWDYARQLTEADILSDPEILWSKIDPAADFNHDLVKTISTAQSGKSFLLSPAFRQLKPSVAVALGEITATMPVTTPIAWTRGLQSNGTWDKFSPYGTYGGFIVFLGGNVQSYRNLNDEGFQLTRFDGKGKTSNILEALPPGTHIGEYTPTTEDQIAWTKIIEWQHKRDFFRRNFPPELWLLSTMWILSIGLALHRVMKKKGRVARLFIWPFVLTILLALLCPAIS